jgi:predicted dehydrogenase
MKAGKGCYCEKPMAVILEHAKRAYHAVKNSKQVVQIGTQVLSSPTSFGARRAVQSGILGKISKIDMFASYWGPRWRGREEVKMIREQDTDWKAWILDRPYRPFDPVLYFEYRIYKDFAAGIAGQWMSHNIAEVGMIMGSTMPSCIHTMGGNYVWKDGREVSDTYHCLIKYPAEFNVSYSCNFGNNFGDYLRFYGLNGTMEKVSGGMESGQYVISGTGGGGEPTPENEEKARKQAGSGMEFRVNKNRIREKKNIEGEGGVPGDDGHMENFLDCMRSRKEPNASILSGYVHSVICIMAHLSDLSGKPFYWDAKREEIVDAQPKA